MDVEMTGTAGLRQVRGRDFLSQGARPIVLAGLFGLVLLTAVTGTVHTLLGTPQSPIPSGFSEQQLLKYFSNLDEAGIAEIETYAIEKLEHNALDTEAPHLLGIVAGLRKDVGRQEEIALNVARYSLRDPSTQLTAANISLARRSYADALYHLDGLLRARPELGPSFFPAMASLIMQDDAVPHVARVVGMDPAWRKSLLQHLIAMPDGWRIVYRLFSTMKKSGAGPTEAERRLVIGQLIKDKQHEQAYFVWLDFLGPEELQRVLQIYDGGFDLAPQNLFFDWNIRPARNMTAEVVTRPGSSINRNLKLDLYAFKDAFANVFQYLRLLPGKYDLLYDVMAESMDAPKGLTWRIRCVESQAVLAESSAVQASIPWTHIITPFVVPEQGCNTQQLKLESVAKSGLDTAVTGILHFDDVRIDPREGTNVSGGGN